MTHKTHKQLWLYGVPSHIGTDPATSQSADSHLAPEAIRSAYESLFQGYNIPCAFEDHGDVETSADQSVEELLTKVGEKTLEALQSGKQVIFLGGSHTFTLGSLRAVKAHRGDFSLLYFDAHPDLMPEERIYYGSTLYHASKEGVLDPKRIGFVGIRQIEEEEADFIEKNGSLVISPLELTRIGLTAAIEKLKQTLPPPYYMSIDLDGIDPSAAPGVTTPFPLGLYPRELLAMALAFCGKDLIGFEIVEHSPKRDVQNCTVFLAATLLQELSSACLST
jgi:agmatinase